MNPETRAIASSILAVAVVVIILAAFSSGFELANLEIRQNPTVTTNTFITSTTVTWVQISGTNHSVFYITEEVVIEPEYVDEVCIAQRTNATIRSTFYLPSGGINGSNPIGLVTTITTYESNTTTSLYDNVTVIFDGSTCTITNPHYGASINQNCVCA